MTDAASKRIGSFVHWREWDGEIIAYNDRTGDTHHFADLSAWLFRLLLCWSEIGTRPMDETAQTRKGETSWVRASTRR